MQCNQPNTKPSLGDVQWKCVQIYTVWGFYGCKNVALSHWEADELWIFYFKQLDKCIGQIVKTCTYGSATPVPVFHVIFDIYLRTHFSFHYNDFSNEKGEHLQHNRNNNHSWMANTQNTMKASPKIQFCVEDSITPNILFSGCSATWGFSFLFPRRKRTFGKTSKFCPFTFSIFLQCEIFV